MYVFRGATNAASAVYLRSDLGVCDREVVLGTWGHEVCVETHEEWGSGRECMHGEGAARSSLSRAEHRVG